MIDRENPEDGRCDVCDSRVGNAHLSNMEVCESCFNLRQRLAGVEELITSVPQIMRRAEAAEARVEELETGIKTLISSAPEKPREVDPSNSGDIADRAADETMIFVADLLRALLAPIDIKPEDERVIRAIFSPAETREEPKPCATCGGTCRAWTEELGTIACPMCRKEPARG